MLEELFCCIKPRAVMQFFYVLLSMFLSQGSFASLGGYKNFTVKDSLTHPHAQKLFSDKATTLPGLAHKDVSAIEFSEDRNSIAIAIKFDENNTPLCYVDVTSQPEILPLGVSSAAKIEEINIPYLKPCGEGEVQKILAMKRESERQTALASGMVAGGILALGLACWSVANSHNEADDVSAHMSFESYGDHDLTTFAGATAATGHAANSLTRVSTSSFSHVLKMAPLPPVFLSASVLISCAAGNVKYYSKKMLQILSQVLTFAFPINSLEQELVQTDPPFAFLAFTLALRSNRICQQAEKEELTDAEINACKHFTWSILLYNKLGLEKASFVLNIHEAEREKGEIMEADTLMDEHNNEVGLKAAQSLSLPKKRGRETNNFLFSHFLRHLHEGSLALSPFDTSTCKQINSASLLNPPSPQLLKLCSYEGYHKSRQNDSVHKSASNVVS